MHSAKKPADPKRYYRRRTGLGFDGRAKPLVKSGTGVARGVRSLAVEVLGSPRSLVELSLHLRSSVPCQASHSLFDLAADVSGCAGYAVFVHGSGPSRRDRRGLPRAALWSAMQRERAGNVPTPVQKGLLFAAGPESSCGTKILASGCQVSSNPRSDSMASDKNLQELFHETLKDIYFAEKKILSALPKMAKAAQSEELKAAFEKHETETEEHVARLEKVFEEIDETPRGKTCDAIMGIIEEGQEVMKEFKGAPALDAGLIAAAQAVEHYEIARYGTLKTWAAELGLNQAMKLLETTLAEEKKTDETLTQLAESEVNQHAQAA